MGIKIRWEGSDIDEKGIDISTNKIVVEVDPKNFSPTEVKGLVGDAAKAKDKLKWKPKTTFNELVKLMVENDFNELSKQYRHI